MPQPDCSSARPRQRGGSLAARGFAILAALVVLLFVPSPAAAARSEFYGIAQGPPFDNQDLAGIQAARVHTVRFLLFWKSAEPGQGSFGRSAHLTPTPTGPPDSRRSPSARSAIRARGTSPSSPGAGPAPRSRPGPARPDSFGRASSRGRSAGRRMCNRRSDWPDLPRKSASPRCLDGAPSRSSPRRKRRGR